MLGPPRPLLALTVALVLSACPRPAFPGAMPFPQDLEPISMVGSECEYQATAGSCSCVGHFLATALPSSCHLPIKLCNFFFQVQ